MPAVEKGALFLAAESDMRKRRFYLTAAVFLIILPVANYFALSFILEYITGDILYRTAETVLFYAIQAFSFALSHICFAFVIVSIMEYGFDRLVIAAGYLSLFIPYISAFLIKAMTNSYFSDYIRYYIAYTALNYLCIDVIILTSVIFFTALFKTRVKKHDPMYAAFFLTVMLLLAFGLIKQTIFTVEFIYELLYEYYSPITFGELVSLISDYLMLAAKAVAGYIIMRLSARFLNIRHGP